MQGLKRVGAMRCFDISLQLSVPIDASASVSERLLHKPFYRYSYRKHKTV